MAELPLTDRAKDEILAHRDGEQVTVNHFLAEVESLAAYLPRQRFSINLCRDRYTFIRSFAAVIARGQTNLLPPNRLDATIDDLLERYPQSYILSDDDADARRCERVDPRKAPAGQDPNAIVPTISPEHRAAIVFTSGSTGQSKAIEKPWRTFFEGSRLIADEMGLSRKQTRHMVATVPAQHMYGLETSVLLPLAGPIAVSNLQPFLPADVAAALAALPAPRILVSTPAHLRSFDDPGVDMPEVEAVWSATAPLDTELALRIEQRHSSRVHEIYGCSETGSLARREPVREEAWSLFRGAGLSIEGGLVRAAAPHLPDTFVLQDCVEMLAPHRFRLVGRSEDLVNIAGKRASLADLNLRLLRIPGVEDAVMFQFPGTKTAATERLAAFVVAPRLDPQKIRQELRKSIDEVFLPRPIRMVERLPREETGKLSRREILHLIDTQAEDSA